MNRLIAVVQTWNKPTVSLKTMQTHEATIRLKKKLLNKITWIINCHGTGMFPQKLLRNTIYCPIIYYLETNLEV
jgi:hypothetical protein